MSEIRVDSMEFQERDLAILRGLFESRVMTTAHAVTLYFEGRGEAAKKRLHKLKEAELIAEHRRRVNEPSVLHLTPKGIAVLRQQGVLAEYPPIVKSSLEKRAQVSDLTLRHELEIMDVKAAFHLAIKKTASFTLEKFSTWPLLYQFEASRSGNRMTKVLVKPDGFIRIREEEPDGGLLEHTFFLEVDRSNEIQNILVTRATCYLDYYTSGGFAETNGAPRTASEDYPFQVLMVFKTAERRNNTAEGLLRSNPPILTQARLSTFAEVISEPLGPIWTCPRDYREVVQGTPFDILRRREAWGYKRQPARDEFVELGLRKFDIFSDEAAA